METQNPWSMETSIFDQNARLPESLDQAGAWVGGASGTAGGPGGNLNLDFIFGGGLAGFSEWTIFRVFGKQLQTLFRIDQKRPSPCKALMSPYEI